jgi:hypothetical protein
MVGAGSNGANNFFGLSGGKNKLHVGRRLFDNLEQRIKTLGRNHVGLVKDKDFVAVAGRRKDCSFSKISCVINAVVARSIDLNHI